ncbi:MAG: AraC family transcriptional regulator ligand-binding domain-containing protein [Cyanobacteria bacterium P01_F01_bin.143]
MTISELNDAFDDNSQRYKMLTSIVANTFNYAVGRGLDIEKISAATGLKRTDLINPESRLPEDLAAKIWKLLGEEYPDQALALHAASAAPISSLGQLALAVQYAENARSSLEALVEYRSVLSDRLTMELVESEAEAIIKVDHPVGDIDGGYGAEAGLAILHRLGNEAVGGENPLLRVNFKHQPFGSLDVYESFFGIPVYFQQPYNALVLRREALDRPTKKGDKHLFRYIQGNLDLLQDHWQLHSNTSQMSELYEIIVRNAEFLEYSAEALAQQMNISLRSLQRLTKEYGLTIRQLMDNARKAQAKRLLRDSSLSIETISNRLSYSDTRAFRRAFKRWTGKTPSEFRNRFR